MTQFARLPIYITHSEGIDPCWRNAKANLFAGNVHMKHRNGWGSAQVVIIGTHLLRKWNKKKALYRQALVQTANR